MEYVSIVVNNGGGRCVGYMQTLGLSDAIAFEKGQDSADPCLEPQVITMMSVSCMVVMWTLMNMRDFSAHSAYSAGE